VASNGKPNATIGVHDLVRRDPYLPSRVVENLFWFGRYCERCDDSARWLRIMLARYVDGDDPQALQAAVELGERLMLLPEEGELPERLLAACSAMTGRSACVQPAALAVGGLAGARQVSGKTGRRWWSCSAKPWSWKPKSRTSASCWISSTGW
jgi:uncharacterized alpha-E superfamily protein